MASETENNEDSEKQSEVVKKKARKARRKQLYKDIRDVMEFYFSPANLSKARYVAAKLEQGNGKIALSEFLTFNKIKPLTNDVDTLKKALSRSPILTVTDDMMVMSTVPVSKKENEDDCVIYVEPVPTDADHKWVSDVFSRYGKIDYVSLPKFPKSNKCKGFAFVEFADPETAEKAIKEFKEIGQYLSECQQPEKLLSNATKDEAVSQGVDGVDENISASDHEKKRRGTKDKSLKRKKVSTEDGDEVTTKKSKSADEAPSASESNRDPEESTDCGDGDGNTEEKKKKNRKKKKKRKKLTLQSFGLQILSKKDWKVLRNKYLTTQKKKMSLLKKRLAEAQKSGVGKDIPKPKTESTLPEQFMHGLIVKVKTDPINDLNDFKKQVNTISSRVNFIDAKEGSDTAMVRLASIDDSKAFCDKSPWPNVSIIDGEEEEQYWKIIRKDREEKRNQSKKVKERGKQKLLKKAEKVLGKHIFFDETG